MRLSRPIYESLPYAYAVIGALALFVAYLDPVGLNAKIAFAIGLAAEIAALTLYLRRFDYRAQGREYSRQMIELPPHLSR
jgi:hypothetical protein